MRLQTLFRSIAVLTISLTMGCSGSNDDSDSSDDDSEGDTSSEVGSLEITDLSDLPDATGPVAALSAEASSAAQSEVTSFDDLEIDTTLRLASNGASIGDTANDLDAAFDARQSSNSDASKAMCDVTNQAMKYLFEMGSGDFLNCVVKTVLTDDSDIYNGKSHTVKMAAEMEGTTMSYIVAVKATRNTDGQLVGYRMDTCESTDGTTFVQNQHLTIDIGSDSYEYYSKMKGPDDNPGMSWVTVTAGLNAEGEVAGIKNIVYNDHNASGHTYAEIKQSENNILYNGDRSNEKYFAFFELIDSNDDDPSTYAISKLAVGDGASYVDYRGTVTTQGWNGDTLAIDASSDYLIKVENKGGSIVELVEVDDPSFASDEQFDCDQTPDTDLGTLDATIFAGCMERFEIDQEGESLCNDLSYD